MLKQFIFLSVALVFVSCATENKKETTTNNLCDENDNKITDRHIVMSAKSKSQALTRCFINYLKFEENKKQTFKVCNVVNVAKTGQVTYSKVFALEGRIPKDFQMCLEQEFWMMNFSKLQLEESHYIKFPLEFRGQ